MAKEKYIVNGHTFPTYEDVVEYNKKNNFKTTGTATVKKNVFVITVNKIN